MNKNLTKMLSKALKEVADKIDAGTCEMSEQEAIDIMNLLSHQLLSKEEACFYLHMSRSKFDQYVREGKLPQGIKRSGITEKLWYKDALVINQ